MPEVLLCCNIDTTPAVSPDAASKQKNPDLFFVLPWCSWQGGLDPHNTTLPSSGERPTVGSCINRVLTLCWTWTRDRQKIDLEFFVVLDSCFWQDCTSIWCCHGLSISWIFLAGCADQSSVVSVRRHWTEQNHGRCPWSDRDGLTLPWRSSPSIAPVHVHHVQYVDHFMRFLLDHQSRRFVRNDCWNHVEY